LSKYTEEEKEFFERRSNENLLVTYREELLTTVGGENGILQLPKNVRRRFKKYGIIRKFGHRYELTPKGREMLAV